MLTQLHTPIPLDTPKGRGFAHFVIDYGQEHSIIWGVLIDATREWWWPRNELVLGTHNWTMGRCDPPPKAPTDNAHQSTTAWWQREQATTAEEISRQANPGAWHPTTP